MRNNNADVKLVRCQSERGETRYQVDKNGKPTGYIFLKPVETRSTTKMYVVKAEGREAGIVEKMRDDKHTTNPWKAFQGIGWANQYVGAFYAEDGGQEAAILAVLNYGPKEFRVLEVSTNANSFGLKGHLMVAEDGTAYEVARSICAQPQWEKGFSVCAQFKNGGWDFSRHGVELPRQLPNAPAQVIAQVFPK